MPKIDIKQIRIAKRYAIALFEIAKSADIIQQVFEELKSVVADCHETKELKDFLESPIISIDDKKEVVDRVFKDSVSEQTYNFLILLAENSRFDLLQAVTDEYNVLLDDLNNVLKANITSAVEINSELKDKLVQKLEYKTSKKVVPVYYIDPEIIGGLIVEVDDKTIDSSIRTKLNNLQKQLI